MSRSLALGITLAVAGCAHAPEPPPPDPARYQAVPDADLTPYAVSTPKPKLPSKATMEAIRYGLRQLEGKYRVCVTSDGRVDAVFAVASMGKTGDDAVIKGVRRWSYKPLPAPTCTLVAVSFTMWGDVAATVQSWVR
jgi:hypothetical protein